MVCRFGLVLLAAASLVACAPITLEPISGVPHFSSADANRMCLVVLTELVSDGAIQDHAIVAAFETTVGGLRTIESHAREAGPQEHELWPDQEPGDPAVLCYLDVGSVRAGPVSGPTTRFVVGYSSTQDSSGWAVIDEGPPETIAVPW